MADEREPKSQFDIESETTNNHPAIVNYIRDIFDAFQNSRAPYEDVWEECIQNFLGEYQSTRRWRDKEGLEGRSQIFVKLTQLKCHTAHSRIVDTMFPGLTGIPFDCDPVNHHELGIPIFEAREAARKMKDRLGAHFKEIELEEKFVDAILEMVVCGTGFIKGPIVEEKTRRMRSPRMVADLPVKDIDPSVNPYEVTEETYVIPNAEPISIWNVYFDCNAKSVGDSIGVIHYERLLPAQLKALAKQGHDPQAIKDAIKYVTPTDEYDNRDKQMGEKFMGQRGEKDDKIVMVEFWGQAPAEYLRNIGLDVPEDAEDGDYLECVVNLAADGFITKAVLNPLNGFRPFWPCPYKKVPNQIYGMGVAELMRDSQKMINSAARMIIDNKALSGNGMVGVNINRIDTKRTKNLSAYPRKVWYTKGNFSPKEAVDAIHFPDVTQGLQELMQMFERFADEETAIPKYTHGTQDTFLNKTATGMSMLINQMSVNMKTVMKCVDNYWIEPLVEAFYDWFMDFDPDHSIKIPLKIKATGTESLITREIKMEKLFQFMQITSAPQDAIFVDRIKLMKEIANALETKDVMRSDEEIQQLMQKMNEEATKETDWIERVDIDRLYPLLTRNEQMQILERLNIQPDFEGPTIPVVKGDERTSQ